MTTKTTFTIDLGDCKNSAFCHPVTIPRRVFDEAYEAFIQNDLMLYTVNCLLIRKYKAIHNLHHNQFISYTQYDGAIIRIIHEMQRKIAKINGEKLYEMQNDRRELREHIKDMRRARSIKSLAYEYKTSYTYMGMALLGKKRLKEVLSRGCAISPASAEEDAWVNEMLILTDEDILHGNMLTHYNPRSVVSDAIFGDDNTAVNNEELVLPQTNSVICNAPESIRNVEIADNLSMTEVPIAETQGTGLPCTLVRQNLKKMGDKGEVTLQQYLALAGLEPTRHYLTEEQQREKHKKAPAGKHCSTTPDILFLDNCELIVDGRVVKWIDAKHTFLMPDITDPSIIKRFMTQIRSYVDAYGPGAIFWTPSDLAVACIHGDMESCLDNVSRINVVHFSCNP